VCKKVTNASATGLSEYIPTTSVAEWQSFVGHPPAGVTLGSCATGITVPCTTNVNLYVLAGSPGSAGAYVFTVPAACIVGSNPTSLPALTTGTWPAGSTITLINNGYVEGMGGSGGNGGSSQVTGGSGYSGGPAISLSYQMTIDNTSGYIFGGGGGGGGGGGAGARTAQPGGGGGGGGQGYGTSAGGGGGGSAPAGAAGGAGSSAAPGSGSGGGSVSGFYGGTGGTGGGWATAGGSGSCGGGPSGNGRCGGGGGAGGAAITLNGFSITWLGGNNGTQVKGAVQ
jgi:hypothetical protein